MYREHLEKNGVCVFNPGLSLCVQGTPFTSATAFNCRRFIPVCTGNTITLDIYCSDKTVYPCVYREHRLLPALDLLLDGLSLCVQGTRINTRLQIDCFRFIPVCTGNTMVLRPIASRKSVYPCVYREH